MIEVSKITIGNKEIIEKDGEIFIDGRHIDTHKYRGILLSWMFIMGAFFGASCLAIMLIFIEYLIKNQ